MTNDAKNIPTILIIEDDLLLLKAYGIKFKKEGWDAVLLSDGAKAMEYFDEPPPDVVLLDLMLHVPRGFEVFEALRKAEKWQNVPVFILASSKTEDDCLRAKAGKLGAVACFHKAQHDMNDIVENIKTFYLHDTTR